jgi:hypothetical protein
VRLSQTAQGHQKEKQNQLELQNQTGNMSQRYLQTGQVSSNLAGQECRPFPEFTPPLPQEHRCRTNVVTGQAPVISPAVDTPTGVGAAAEGQALKLAG